MFVGIEEIMTAAERHFTMKDAVWSWTELSRRVDWKSVMDQGTLLELSGA